RLTQTNHHQTTRHVVQRVLNLILQRPGDRRTLPSFPTRRSSDLAARPAQAARLPVTPAAACVRRRPAVDGPDPAHPPAQAQRGRSEEHTSELQSQSNLVCRLLLEKKKTISTQAPR